MIVTGDKAVTDIVSKMELIKVERNRAQKIKENWRILREQGYGYLNPGETLASYDYENGRMLYDIMPDGSWEGQRCFIIGGGPSLKEFDFSKLKNELVIGINRAYEKIDCTINFSMDNRLYDWIKNGALGEESKEKFENFQGVPVWVDVVGYDYPKGIYILHKAKDQKFNFRMKEGIITETNSGFGALYLAACLGANPIYLLGFDMKGFSGKSTWWHDGYPRKQGAVVYKSFINGFDKIAPILKRKDIKVVNLNPDSALKCFEFQGVKKVKEKKKVIFISYYTKNTGYEQEVEHLKATLQRFNLDNDVVGIEDKGSWHKNTYFKANFVQQMLKKYPDRGVVFVDADAKIRANPVLFSELDCDFACHFRHGKELLSGTAYFGPTKGARFLVDKWVEENKLQPDTHMPQKNLRAVFDRHKGEISWDDLPVSYCMIFDSRVRRTTSPVIEHFQLSRQHKPKKVQRSKYRMRRSLAEIRNFCKGKRICLIGNANSVLKEKRDINGYDIVCRINRGTPKGKEDFIGSRTDILFLATQISRGNIKQSFSPKFMVWTTICKRLANPWIMLNAIQSPSKDWTELYNKLSINPTTGFVALNFLLKYTDFKSLDIYGFDFFTTKTWYNTKVDSGQKHSGKKEKTLINALISKRENVNLK